MSGWSNIGHCEQTILFWGKTILTFAYAGRSRRSGSTHKYAFTISENCTVRWDAVGENNGLSVRAFLIISVRIYLWLHYIKIKCALTLPSQTIIVSVCRNTPLSFCCTSYHAQTVIHHFHLHSDSWQGICVTGN